MDYKLPETVSEWGIYDYVPNIFQGFYGISELGVLGPGNFKKFFERQDRNLVTITESDEKRIELADGLIDTANALMEDETLRANRLPVLNEIVTAIAYIYGGKDFANKWGKYTQSCTDVFNSVYAC